MATASFNGVWGAVFASYLLAWSWNVLLVYREQAHADDAR